MRFQNQLKDKGTFVSGAVTLLSIFIESPPMWINRALHTSIKE